MNDEKDASGLAKKGAPTSVGAPLAVTEAKKKAQAQVDAQRRRAVVTWVVVGVVVVGLVGALVAFIVRQGAVGDVAVHGPSGAQVLTSDGGIGVGSSGVAGRDLDPAHVRLDVYFDFICPWCAQFELTQAETLDELRSQGIVDVYYHPLSYLDPQSSGTQYSTRAASAAALVAQESPEFFLDFVKLLMANQPPEGSTGLSDDQIQSFALAAGVSDAVVAKIPDHEYAGWVRSASEAASKRGVVYTPTIGFNGGIQDPTDPASVQWTQEGALRQAITEQYGK